MRGRRKIGSSTGQQSLVQSVMQFTVSDDIVIETKETELIINSAVKVGMNLKRKYLVLTAMIKKRMYLIPVDNINIPGMSVHAV